MVVIFKIRVIKIETQKVNSSCNNTYHDYHKLHMFYYVTLVAGQRIFEVFSNFILLIFEKRVFFLGGGGLLVVEGRRCYGWGKGLLFYHFFRFGKNYYKEQLNKYIVRYRFLPRH